MDTQTIVIESDVVESIFRPISMFLNDIVKGSVLTFLSVDTRERANSDKLLQVYKFLSSTGEVYSFTQYDLSRFQSNGKNLDEHFKLIKDRDATLCQSFTVIESLPRTTRDGDKMYPDFMFSGYETFLLHREVEGANIKELKKILYTTKVLPDFIDRYYRILNIDQDIIYYEKA